MSLEDKNGRKGVRSSGFSTPAPVALESRQRKEVSETGNLSQRMNRRSSPNRRLMRSSCRIVITEDVFPIPPAPTRAIGVRRSTNVTIFSTSSSRPKKILGGGGGNSPATLDIDVRGWAPY